MHSTTRYAAGSAPAAVGGRSPWGLFARGVKGFNILTGYLSAVTIVVTSIIVCYGVVMRYFFSSPIDWGLELSIFLLIAATFMSAGLTQLQRGHVTIELFEHMLSPRANRWRYLIGDTLSLVFCAFLAWNAWTFFHEAFEDGRVTDSTWGPKLWVPYLFMAIGSSALALQLFVQIVEGILNRPAPVSEAAEANDPASPN
ncbi:MAG TPA: TRAP transporter small permease [Rhodocyclaceae bacterium]|nr:TRAP transporter small permease [Rhodocyclaceae bacterium]